MNDGSYLQVTHTQSATHGAGNTDITVQTQEYHKEGMSSNQAILEMLHKIDASNQALSKRMDNLERQGSVSSTPMVSPTSQHQIAGFPADIQQRRGHGTVTQASTFTTQSVPSMRPGLAGTQMTNAPLAQPIPSSARVQTQVAQDAVAPRLDVMRSIPSICSSVSHLLAQYEDRADQETFPGKTSSIRKKSGRYNVTDTSLVSP